MTNANMQLYILFIFVYIIQVEMTINCTQNAISCLVNNLHLIGQMEWFWSQINFIDISNSKRYKNLTITIRNVSVCNDTNTFLLVYGYRTTANGYKHNDNIIEQFCENISGIVARFCAQYQQNTLNFNFQDYKIY